MRCSGNVCSTAISIRKKTFTTVLSKTTHKVSTQCSNQKESNRVLSTSNNISGIIDSYLYDFPRSLKISGSFLYARHEHCLTGASPGRALIVGIAQPKARVPIGKDRTVQSI